jgi:hypothetical protein
MTRLTILEQDEIDKFYKIPQLNYAEKESFFVLSEQDIVYLDKNCIQFTAKINYILQVGYFRAVHYFFRINFFSVRADVKFILSKYFLDCSFPIQNASDRIHYRNQKTIQKLYHFKLTTKLFLEKIRKHGQEIAKVDSRAKFIFYELLNFCQQNSVLRPTYSTLQILVSYVLKKEKSRLCNKMKILLDKQTKDSLKNLLTTEELFYKLTLIKKDPKDFSTREIQKELTKRGYIATIFYKAEQILPIIGISNQNIQYYASLAEFYDINKLKRFNPAIQHLYLLCFSWLRFKEINDHLIAYFIYKTNCYVKEGEQSAEKEIYKAKLTDDKDRIKAGQILKILSDQKNDDNMLRPKAYKIVSEENFLNFTKRFIKPNFDKNHYEWQYYARIRHKIKMNLRPVFKDLVFDCQHKIELFKVITFLRNSFKKHKIFKKYKLSEIHMNFFSKRLIKYLKKK